MIQAITNQQVGLKFVTFWYLMLSFSVFLYATFIALSPNLLLDTPSRVVQLVWDLFFGPCLVHILLNRPPLLFSYDDVQDLGLYHYGASFAIRGRFQTRPLHEGPATFNVHVSGTIRFIKYRLTNLIQRRWIDRCNCRCWYSTTRCPGMDVREHQRHLWSSTKRRVNQLYSPL